MLIIFFVALEFSYVVMLVRASTHRHTSAVQKHTRGIRCLNVLLN